MKYSYNNKINFNYLHYTQCHQQTPFACLLNAYTCIYTKSLRSRAVFRHTRAMQTLWTLVNPNMYMCRVDIFSHYSLYFSYLIFPQKDFIIPHIIHNRMTDFLHHHNIMYDFTPLYSPIICKDNFPLVYMYKSSRYYAVFQINLGSIFPQSPTLSVLTPAPLQPSSTLATIASNFLVLLLSPPITIHPCCIFTQD